MKANTLTAILRIAAVAALAMGVVSSRAGKPASSNAADRFLREYRTRIAQVYRDAAAAADSNQLKDLADAADFIGKAADQARQAARKETIDPLMESINGDKWTNAGAASIFRDLAEGFEP